MGYEPASAPTSGPGQAGRIVVGYDGSEPGVAALDWAAAEARRRRIPLTVLCVAGLPAGLTEPEARQIGAQAVTRVRQNPESIEVRTLVCRSRVARSLIANSRAAALLVVGTRDRSELSGTVLGSVAATVSAHAHCPVVVVRGDSARPPGPDRPVVVAVDGSAGTQTAVQFAADLAGRSRAPLLLITAYQSGSTRSAGPWWWPRLEEFSPPGGHHPDLETIARMNAGELTSNAFRNAVSTHPTLSVRQQLIEGPVTDVLITAALGSGLLVIGSGERSEGRSEGRSGKHSGLAGLSFGSLSLRSVRNEVLHCSPCPVAVVRCPGVLPERTAAAARVNPFTSGYETLSYGFTPAYGRRTTTGSDANGGSAQ